jgi:hypothetical protein
MPASSSSPRSALLWPGAGASASVPGSVPGGSSVVGGYVWPLGNGSMSATPKMTTITAISTRFAKETVKMDQCRYVPG